MDPITKHHYENIANGTAVQNDDGSLSTVKTIIVEIDGMEVLIPTVWNGEIVDDATAIENAKSSGISWPSDEASEEGRARLQALDDEAHLEMNDQTTPEEAQAMLSPSEDVSMSDTPDDMGFMLGGLATSTKGITTQAGLDMASKKFQLDDAQADKDGDGKLSAREKEVGKAVQRNVDEEVTEDDAVTMFHGGMMMDGLMGYDDVSGNPIPLGSSAENVRDDIDAKISTDEYVLPANVVKWHGLKHIMELQSEAEMGLMSMNMDGLIQQVDEEPTSKSEKTKDKETDVEVAAVEVDDHLEGGKDKKTYPKTSKLPSVRQNKTVAYMV